jgi:hypothetical protein
MAVAGVRHAVGSPGIGAGGGGPTGPGGWRRGIGCAATGTGAGQAALGLGFGFGFVLMIDHGVAFLVLSLLVMGLFQIGEVVIDGL